MDGERGRGFDPAACEPRRRGGDFADHPFDLGDSVAAALREIEGMRAERAAAPVRSARLTLAAVYGATRLKRKLERESVHAGA